MRRLAFVAVLCACGPGLQRVYPSLLPPLSSYDFGAVPVLNEKTLEIGVKNVGRAEMLVTNVHLSEGEGPITIKSFPEAVGIGEEKPIVVSFVPLREQEYRAKLVFETDDIENPTVEVELVGMGSTRAVMVLTPEMIDFGRVAECSSAVQTFTIESKGTADLVISTIEFIEGSDPSFTKVGSWTTPATVKFKAANGLPGLITLTVKLTVTGGASGTLTGGVRIKGTDPDKQEVVIPLTATVNKAPIANIAPLGNGAPGQIVMLDGSASMDPDGDVPLTYKWTLRSSPIGTSTSIAPQDMPMASMMLDGMLPGAYEVQLDVTDGAGAKNCMPTRATIVASPAQKLLVEMFWDNSKTDIDLHVLRTPTSVVGRAPDDCHYANTQPDWGMPGTMDDPQLLRDALTGYGPEIFGYINPVDSTYRVLAEFANEHLEPNPASNVTIRVYLFGVVKFEQTRQLTMKGQRWAAVDVSWPSGMVTPVP